jgi:hypothetical protein
MATENIQVSNDGCIIINNSSYIDARNAAAGDTALTDRIDVGQTVSLPGVRRGFVSANLPAMSAVSAASLFFYGRGNNSIVDFNLYIHTSTYSNPLVKEDFDLFDGHQASKVYTGTVLNNTWNSVSYSSTWNEITFNAAGLAAILAASGSTVKLALISENDYTSTVPSNYEYVSLWSTYTAGKEPYLSLTYTQPFIPTSSMRRGILSGVGRGI